MSAGVSESLTRYTSPLPHSNLQIHQFIRIYLIMPGGSWGGCCAHYLVSLSRNRWGRGKLVELFIDSYNMSVHCVGGNSKI